MTREEYIQTLCKSVIEAADQLVYNDHGYDYCFFCGAEDGRYGLKHKQDCPIWIAKDLSARRKLKAGKAGRR